MAEKPSTTIILPAPQRDTYILKDIRYDAAAVGTYTYTKAMLEASQTDGKVH